MKVVTLSILSQLLFTTISTRLSASSTFFPSCCNTQDNLHCLQPAAFQFFPSCCLSHTLMES
ncbi:MAG: hypothetical protein N3E41_08645 [Thermofilaceae archaeon]|nr:hypothetical protein [Thermofilaceae archaeon]